MEGQDSDVQYSAGQAAAAAAVAAGIKLATMLSDSRCKLAGYVSIKSMPTGITMKAIALWELREGGRQTGTNARAADLALLQAHEPCEAHL